MADEFVDSGSLGGSESPSVDSSTTGSTTPNTGTTPQSTEQTVSIKWNGREEKVPYSRAIELAQKGFDYTQKMQTLAREREEFGATRQRYDQAFGEVRSFLQDPQKIRGYLQRLEGATGAAVQQASQTGDPDDIVTANQLQQKLAEAKQEFTGFTQNQLASLREQMQVENLAGQYSNDLNSHIGGLKKALPELRAIPKIDQILREDVRAMRPGNIQEAKEMMIEVAKQHAQTIKQFMLEQRKEGSAGAVNPLRNGIEPAGGSAPMPPAPSEKYAGGIKNQQFKNAVVAELMQLAQQK